MTKDQLYRGVVDLYKTYHNVRHAMVCAERANVIRFNLKNFGKPLFPSQIVR